MCTNIDEQQQKHTPTTDNVNWHLLIAAYINSSELPRMHILLDVKWLLPIAEVAKWLLPITDVVKWLLPQPYDHECEYECE